MNWRTKKLAGDVGDFRKRRAGERAEEIKYCSVVACQCLHTVSFPFVSLSPLFRVPRVWFFSWTNSEPEQHRHRK